eukprot:s365_g18.t1
MELISTIQEVLAAGELKRFSAESLRGQSSVCVEKSLWFRFKCCLKYLNQHISRGFCSLTPELFCALRLIKHLLENNTPRIVEVRHFEWVHLYVDAAYEPDGASGIGGVLLDQASVCLGFFSEVVSNELVTDLKRESQETVIFELEGLAIAIGLSIIKTFISGKRVVVFTDNQGVQSSVIKRGTWRHRPSFCVAGKVALMALGWLWCVASGAVAVCVAGVELGDTELHSVWNEVAFGDAGSGGLLWAPRLFAGSSSVCGRRGTLRHRP